MTGMVDILWRILKRVQKKFKMKSQVRKILVWFGKFIWKRSKIVLIWVLWLKFYLFSNFLKIAPDDIHPSGRFVFYGISKWGFNNKNYLEIQKNLISKFFAQMIQNISIGNFRTSWSPWLFCFWHDKMRFSIKQPIFAWSAWRCHLRM